MEMNINNIEVESESLIYLVKERPILWDKTVHDYKNKIKTQKAWKEVCGNLIEGYETLPDEDQQELGRIIVKKWTNLRDNWMKWNKKHEYRKKRGIKPLRKYIYHDNMTFLKKVAIHGENTNSSLALDEENIISNNFSMKDTNNVYSRATPFYKRKKTVDEIKAKMQKLPEKEPNRHLSFFQGVLPTLKQFDEEQTLDFQMGVLQLIKNIKISKNNSSTSQPSESHPIPGCSKFEVI